MLRRRRRAKKKEKKLKKKRTNKKKKKGAKKKKKGTQKKKKNKTTKKTKKKKRIKKTPEREKSPLVAPDTSEMHKSARPAYQDQGRVSRATHAGDSHAPSAHLHAQPPKLFPRAVFSSHQPRLV